MVERRGIRGSHMLTKVALAGYAPQLYQTLVVFYFSCYHYKPEA